MSAKELRLKRCITSSTLLEVRSLCARIRRPRDSYLEWHVKSAKRTENVKSIFLPLLMLEKYPHQKPQRLLILSKNKFARRNKCLRNILADL